nr:maltose ABC transporter permease MalF [Bacillota bacterium]
MQPQEHRKTPARLALRLAFPSGWGWYVRLALLAALDAVIIPFLIQLLRDGQYVFFASVAVGVLLINIVSLVERAYPARYLLPGLLFMAAMVVYPMLYNIYVSFTNYGTGNILSMEQVIRQLEAQTYAPPDAPRYRYEVFENARGEMTLLLAAPDGELLVSVGQQVVPLRDVWGPEAVGLEDDPDFRLDVVVDDAGNIVQIGDARRLERRDVLQRLRSLQELRLEMDGVVLQMADASTFRELRPRYTYVRSENVLIDNQTGVVYTPKDGFFTSPDGERLLPGFRVTVGFANYVRLLTNPAISGPFFKIFTWTFVWAGASVLLTFTMGLGLALILNHPHMKLKGLYRSLLIIPYAVPGFIGALVWRGLFNTEFGQVNRIVQALFDTTIPWLQDPFWAKVAVLIVNLWLGYPYMMIVSLGALQSISPELYEAAYCDGAKPWQQFRYITLPLLMTSVAPLLISSFAFNFNNFTVIYLVTRGRPPIAGAITPAGATDILISYTYRLAFEGGRGADYGLAAAVSMLIFIIVGTITWFNFRFTRALEEVDHSA